MLEDFILLAKLTAPPLRKGCVVRPRLLRLLDNSLDRALTLVSAPAGFGKTTLAGQWVRRLTHPVVWFSIEAGDDHPVRFLRYLLQGIAGAVPRLEGALASLLEGAPQLSPLPVLGHVLNLLATAPDNLALVLDDYQFITDPRIHEALAFWIEHQSPNLHTVITTRQDPPFPLARWGARAQMCEVRAPQLRFTEDEIATFLNDSHGLRLASERVVALERRTEGWISALELAALSLRSQEDPAAFIETFAGDHRRLVDYLTAEVFSQQPPEIQTFLLESSLLERFSAPLCDAVLERQDSAVFLEALDRANLFVAPLDDRRAWYRYHRLFGGWLRLKCRETRPDRAPGLHRRAAVWLEEHGQVHDALDHAFQAGDAAFTLRLLERHAQSFVKRGDIRAVIEACRRLPRADLIASPALAVSAAWAYFLASRFDEVRALLADLEMASREVAGAGEAGALWLAEWLTLRSFLSRMAGETQAGIAQARRAQAQTAGDDVFLRGLQATSLGGLYRDAGRLPEAVAAQQEAWALNRQAGNMSAAAMAAYNLVVLLRMQGRLTRALQWVSGVAGAGDAPWQRVPAFGAVFVALGELLYERNDLAQAEAYLRKGIDLSRRGGYDYAGALGLTALGWLLHIAGDEEAARAAFADAAAPARGNALSAARHASVAARFFLMQGELLEARRILAEYAAPAEPLTAAHALPVTLAQARLWLAEGRPEAAAPLLESLLEQLERQEAHGAALEVRVLLALVQRHTASPRGAGAALRGLEQTLPLAAREGYTRLFLDEGAPLWDLLRRVRDLEPAHRAYLDALLGETAPAAAPAALSPSMAIVEALTEQELRILRLIDAGLGNREIAEALTVTLNTVKTHVRNLYGKLDAHSRIQAVARARDLGLL